MEVQHDPVEATCTHAFCRACVSQHLQYQQSCPVCRATPVTVTTARDVDARSSLRVVCVCGTQVTLPNLRKHMESCGAYADHSSRAAASVARAPEGLVAPNRSTFACPFCPAGFPKLARAELLAHLQEVHGSGACRPAVCPLCAAMPWGDPSYVSSNLLQHFTLRHRFDYDTTTDFAQDEEALMAEVLRRSVNET